MTCQFKIDIFEGPLDLLLYLLRESKLDIVDIPISDITKQYVEYIDLMQELNLEVAGEYLIMAAELTRIKSRMLLPKAPVEEGGEEGPDPRAELARRLLEYQRYKNAAFELRNKEHERQQIFLRGSEVLLEEEGDDTLVDATVFDLFAAFKKIMEEKQLDPSYEIEINTLSVSDRIHYLLEILNASESVTFQSLFTVINTKQEIIVTFLAMLELMRLKLARVQQGDHYDTIRVYVAADRETQAQVMKDYEDPGLPPRKMPCPAPTPDFFPT